MPISKLGQRRQVVIPKEICDDLGIEIGDDIEVVQDQGAIILRPKKQTNLEDTLTREEKDIVRQGIADVERGDVLTLDELDHELDD